jgi:hypothetical protein
MIRQSHCGSSRASILRIVRIPGGCDMIAEWIVIYAVVFVLCAVVVGHIPTKH